MPQIYAPDTYVRRRRSSSASSSSSTSSTASPQPIDADDSIVLSDLLRTGEASRLRRRGAMRIDPAVLNQNSSSPDHIRVHNVVVVDRTPPWDQEYDFDLAHTMPARRRRSARRYGPYESGSSATQPEEDDVYSLVCGARTHDSGSLEDTEPFKPSVLPLYPEHADRHGKERERDVNRSTGCGSLVHVRAAPRSRSGVWTALGLASSSVVPLDASYFDTREAAKISCSPCGCVREGVGCAVCGNPLGIRYLPCKSAADAFFSSAQADKLLTQGGSSGPSTRLRGPEGPQYWHPGYAPPRRESRHERRMIYTFFAGAVTPSPSYDFPPPKSRADPTSSSRTTRPRVYSNASASSDVSLEIISSPVVPATRGYVTEERWSEDASDDEFELDQIVVRVTDMIPARRSALDQHFLDVHPRDDSGMPFPETIFDRGVTSSPTPLSDVGEGSPPNPRHDLPQATSQRPYPHVPARRPVIYPPILSASSSSTSASSPVSFYQQQVIGAWERERERERQSQRRAEEFRTNPGFADPDGENFVWGSDVVGVGAGAAGIFDELDKSQECLVFPER